MLSDIRLTEREVILARTDRKTSELKLSNPRSGHFAANFEFPISGEENFVLLRGWASVDVKVRGKSLRFVTTHPEDEFEEVRPRRSRSFWGRRTRRSRSWWSQRLPWRRIRRRLAPGAPERREQHLLQ
jgi:hypothetical protein